jgi:hypothetical protein
MCHVKIPRIRNGDAGAVWRFGEDGRKLRYDRNALPISVMFDPSLETFSQIESLHKSVRSLRSARRKPTISRQSAVRAADSIRHMRVGRMEEPYP